MLCEMVVSQMQTNSSLEELFFQQDGTPSHYVFRTRDYLNQFLVERYSGTVYLLMGHPVNRSKTKSSDNFDNN